MSGGTPHIPAGVKVTPQVMCGPVQPANRTALDWSWLGPVAFGCSKYVVVVDPRTSQNLQTLDGHSTNIIKVRWSRQLHHCTLASPYILRLASVDANGQCIVWDVGQATHISNFSIGNKPLVDIQWLTTNDTCRDLLLIFTSPGTMCIWNADTGTRISRTTFAENILSFSFNHFSPDQLVLLSADYFIFINDFNPPKNTSGTSKKMYMNVPHHQSIGGGGRGWSRDAPRRLLSDESLNNDDSLSLSDCLQVSFSPICRSHLFLLYSREVLIIDTDIMQAIGSIYLERVTAPFLQLFPCQQRDALYCLHENGSISFRVRQPVEFPRTHTLTMADFRELIDVTYDLYYLTEPQRISKNIKPLAFSVCPTTELQLSVLTSEGKLLFWDVGFECMGLYDGRRGEEGGSPLSLISALPVTNGGDRPIGSSCEGLTLSQSIAPHWFNPSDGTNIYTLVSPYMTLTNIYYGLASAPTVLKMCPPLTTKNWHFYKPLVAVGNGTGGVQIVNLSTRQLYREITVHTCAVRGIEWLNHNTLITFAYPPPNSNGLVRNELAAVSLDTGHVNQLKKGENNYVQPITGVRISTHKNYFVVNIKDTPPEFYNAKTLSFMRSLESKPASFVAVEWANVSAFSSFVPKPHPHNQRVSSPAHKTETELESIQTIKQSQLPEKEILSLIDANSNIHHITVDRAGFQLGPQSSQNFALRSPTAMSWKGDTLVSGDSEGTLILWDINASSLKYLETPKSQIKKMKFGPGKGNKRLLVLYNNRLDIREINMKEDDITGQYKWSKGDLSVEDLDWCSSDKLICLMSDGTIRVTDVKFIYSSTAYNPSDYHETVFNPSIVLPQSMFRFKCLLQHQSWNIEYTLDQFDFSDSSSDPIEKGVATLLKTLPNRFRDSLLNAKLGTPQRSLVAAILLGDEFEMQFWTTALYHMIKEKSRLQDPQYKKYHYSSAPDTNDDSDLFQPDSNASTDIESALRNSLEDLLEDDGRSSSDTLIQESNQRTWQLTPPLDLNYDLFMDQDIYKYYQLHRVLCHDGRRHTLSQTRHCAETLLFLKQTDRAVQLLLETDTSSSDYYTDALKACLAATIRSSGASQSTIKLVATNLIANNKLSEGAQLLALIDKGLDACRYMQTYGQWYMSVWLAKSTLNEREAKEVIMRWGEHLASSSVNQKKRLFLSICRSVNLLKLPKCCTV
ncbi:PREDICTED: WD repeat-containing protein 11-like isoform X2 [Amphimedon queenslandica]|uniref:WD repeat-containing protein 11 n=1 Tax=Amphimedon queenslandica TaxID=400682 RepID=A0AAN0K5A1_AMPQE|nr:PREDICTED: WD repeat-containing protein 11-like isoform X2 [Amphimedon queenslandica]|eukprot:XP_019864425.1 PREDICTED: WD repeat-containing protein 11-like isoform X2 [Amphimedon queenslandica]